MIVKKKKGEDGKFEVVKDVITFETANKDLLERVVSESSNILPSERQTHRNGEAETSIPKAAPTSFMLEVKPHTTSSHFKVQRTSGLGVYRQNHLWHRRSN